MEAETPSTRASLQRARAILAVLLVVTILLLWAASRPSRPCVGFRVEVSFLGYSNAHNTTVSLWRLHNLGEYTLKRTQPGTVYWTQADGSITNSEFLLPSESMLRPGDAEIVSLPAVTNGVSWQPQFPFECLKRSERSLFRFLRDLAITDGDDFDWLTESYHYLLGPEMPTSSTGSQPAIPPPRVPSDADSHHSQSVAPSPASAP